MTAAAGSFARYFYPRPPRGGRPEEVAKHGRQKYFYPRPPRGGRLLTAAAGSFARYFYPRPPRGGRPEEVAKHGRQKYFYPRPPRGGRRHAYDVIKRIKKFLSTPSARRATTQCRNSLFKHRFLSTPSARRATFHLVSFRPGFTNFYPRPPRGGRPYTLYASRMAAVFLSTPSARRATAPRFPS